MLGNLFHPQNPQNATYTFPQNHLKGLQTAGGNKFVMSDTQGAQTILISNSNKKGTSILVGFKGDGSITIKSNGPVTVLSPNITLEAGEKGSIKLHAKTISMTAEEDITATAHRSIEAAATQNLVLRAQQAASLTGQQSAGLLSPATVDVGQGTTVNISGAVINQS